MRIVGLVASPRKQSNTDLIVTQILEGAKASNHLVEKIYVYGLNLSPCIDCQACKKGSFQCAIHDDMQILYPEIEAADLIVFGTPLYWYGPSAPMKLVIDRLRPFIGSKKLKNKKAILVIPSEEGAEACNLIVGMFELSFHYLEMVITNKILPAAFERAEVKNQPQILDRAFQIGKKLK